MFTSSFFCLFFFPAVSLWWRNFRDRTCMILLPTISECSNTLYGTEAVAKGDPKHPRDGHRDPDPAPSSERFGKASIRPSIPSVEGSVGPWTFLGIPRIAEGCDRRAWMDRTIRSTPRKLRGEAWEILRAREHPAVVVLLLKTKFDLSKTSNNKNKKTSWPVMIRNIVENEICRYTTFEK